MNEQTRLLKEPYITQQIAELDRIEAVGEKPWSFGPFCILLPAGAGNVFTLFGYPVMQWTTPGYDCYIDEIWGKLRTCRTIPPITPWQYTDIALRSPNSATYFQLFVNGEPRIPETRDDPVAANARKMTPNPEVIDRAGLTGRYQILTTKPIVMHTGDVFQFNMAHTHLVHDLEWNLIFYGHNEKAQVK
jgi:hypothetical protein